MRQLLANIRHRTSQDFLNQKPISQLLKNFTHDIDAFLLSLWKKEQLDHYSTLCLIACGGYGREELQLYSDIDILILSESPLNEQQKNTIEHFIQQGWDAGLQLGQNVQTLEHCVEQAKSDITIVTALLEARLLIGNHELFHRLQNAMSHVWSHHDFFDAKWKEQQHRYAKYENTTYSLEPNVKQGPGGLRDIHMITWVAKRYYGVTSLRDLIPRGILSQDEYQLLTSGQEFLWRIIFALHILTGRAESRLLFDYQIKLALQFGYEDNSQHLAIEQFMKDYFRAANSLRELNNMLLQFFREEMWETSDKNIVNLNDRFQLNNSAIEVKHPRIFRENPESLLEIFLFMAQHPEIRGARAATIRLIHEHAFLIDDAFRKNKQHCQLFIDLLRQSSDISIVLQRMHRYGIFSNYLPAFGHVVGQMQYDLFHVYTVDQHTLFVIRNLCRFYQPEFRGQFPLCAEIIETITKPELLYLAALFHDIAKGRGGDHSSLGAHDALEFCERHGISEEDSTLVEWLVQHHLVMSMTAQREDIYDPNTVVTFANKLKGQRELDYLYLLTVADIHATNPSLWNSWKDSLLKELYERTKQQLRQQNKTIDILQFVREKRATAYELLSPNIIKPTVINELWQHFPQTYYLEESPANIAWHTQSILEHNDSPEPLVLIKQHKAATEIVIYCKIKVNLFAVSTAVLANLNLNILEARINNFTNGYTLSCYSVHDENSKTIDSPDYLNEIKQTLIKSHLSSNKLHKLRKKRLPKHFHHFPHKPTIEFKTDTHRQRTIMEITTLDRPGLLAEIGEIFIKFDVQLHQAKIITMGERVVDRFLITDQQEKMITDENKLGTLREDVLKVLR